MMSPQNMLMNMHMVGVMYAPAERVTLGVMANYNKNNMRMWIKTSLESDMVDHEHNHPGMDHSNSNTETPVLTQMNAEGLGNVHVSGLYRVLFNASHCLHTIAGITLRPGNVETTETSKGHEHGVHTETGLLSPFLGVNYSRLFSRYLIGAQVLYSVPVHLRNSVYASAALYEFNVWGSRKLARWLSTSIRIRGFYHTAPVGAIEAVMSTAQNLYTIEYYLLEAAAGVNMMPYRRWRFGVEVGIPAIQWNKNVGMNKTWFAVAGMQFMIH
ncbi:MAG: hypothetical protein Kow0075_08950 [Salibacteraceae bacterium]